MEVTHHGNQVRRRRGAVRRLPGLSAAIISILALVIGVTVAWKAFYGRKPAPLPEAFQADLQLRDGKLYLTNQTAAFHGVMVERYPDGKTKSRSEIIDGLMDGVSEGYFTNGQMQVRELFRGGVSHGLRTKWHENGQKASEATVVQGKIDGTFQRWHEDGKLAEQIEMKEGNPHGTSRAWFPSGSLKAQARLENGNVLEQKFYKDGEVKGEPRK